jgi:hypothetical protein
MTLNDAMRDRHAYADPFEFLGTVRALQHTERFIRVLQCRSRLPTEPGASPNAINVPVAPGGTCRLQG